MLNRFILRTRRKRRRKKREREREKEREREREREEEKKGGAAKRRTGQPTGEKDAFEAGRPSHWSAAGCRMEAEPISFRPARFHPLPPGWGS